MKAQKNRVAMKPHLRIVVLLCLGLIPEAQLFAAQDDPLESSGRTWAAKWLNTVRTKHNSALPVNIPTSLPKRGQDLATPTPRLVKPLITGPFALLVNLAAGIPAPPPNSSEFGYWIKFEADDDMRDRYEKIMGDLKTYYVGRGYNEINAKQLAERLFHAKSEIYYPLVRV